MKMIQMRAMLNDDLGRLGADPMEHRRIVSDILLLPIAPAIVRRLRARAQKIGIDDDRLSVLHRLYMSGVLEAINSPDVDATIDSLRRRWTVGGVMA